MEIGSVALSEVSADFRGSSFVGPGPDIFQMSVNDEFSFLVSSQLMTAAPQQFLVDILPVDDGTPRIVTNLGLQWLEYMDGKVRPFYLL